MILYVASSKRTKAMTVNVNVQIACATSTVPTEQQIVDWIERSLGQASGDISLRVVDREEIQSLNREFRGQDKPTNVLSFPAGTVEGLPAGSPKPLGDIVICAPLVESEASEQHKEPADHWAHLLVHGTLHLLGFDHETDDDAAIMEGREVEILAAHGIGNPYAQPPQQT